MRLIGLVLALGLVLAPLAAEGQAGRAYRIGYLTPRSGIESREEAFRQGLRQLGYVEGQNLIIEWRFAKGGGDAVYRELAAELVRLKPDCILAMGITPVAALKQATATIPIVIGTIDSDPVEHGLVASLARPGGNITGMTSMAHDLAGKRLELLKEVVPGASRVAILTEWSLAAKAHVRVATAAARNLGMELHVMEARSPDDLEPAFRVARQKRVEALSVVATGLINSHRARIIKLAVSTRLPTIYSIRDFVLEGGLMTYANEPVAQAHRAAAYVDKVLKGAPPADLPLEQPTRFELLINLKAAKQIGLTIPPLLLGRADQVIE